MCTQDYVSDISKSGFQDLQIQIQHFLEKCRIESLYISAAHADRFRSVINCLIAEHEKDCEEKKN